MMDPPNQMSGEDSDSEDESSTSTPQVEDMSDSSSLQQEATCKDCTVVLRRLLPEDEEKDDMSRKSGKHPVSRIPTFQSTLAKKRPTGGSTEPTAPPLTKREANSQTTEKTSSGGDASSRSKLPNIRETALPLLSARLPKYNAEALAQASSNPDQAITLRSLSSTHEIQNDRLIPEAPEELYGMTVDARPALRAEPVDRGGPEPRESDDDYSNGRSFTLIVEKKGADEISEAQVTMGEGLFSEAEKMEPFGMVETEEVVEVLTRARRGGERDDDEEEEGEVAEKDLTLPRGGGECETEEMAEVAEKHLTLAEDIQECDDDDDDDDDEKPVCEEGSLDSEHDATEPTCLEAEPAFVPGLVEKYQQPPVNHKSAWVRHPKVLEEPLERASGSGTPNKGSCCWSFALFCLFPTALLLAGGLGQHAWHYGIPPSVERLMAQLELHWLEGFGIVPEEACSSDCRISLVESIPQGLYYPSEPSTPLPSISDTWISLLSRANYSVDIAAFYFTLRDADLGITEPSASQGKEVFNRLMQLQHRGVKLQIAVNSPQSSTEDTAELASTGAEVREVDLQSVTGGIVHTKLWVVDQTDLYLGSANMDWRSLTQVKEVGVAVENCSCLAQDAARILGVYWDIGVQKNGSLPPYWPARYSALSSAEHPLNLRLNDVPAQVYLSSAPPQISARGRSDDLATILSVIADAQKFVSISVMDFLPLSQFTEPLRFWPVIDSSLRAAACTRGVEVNLLVSCWQHSPRSMFIFLQSLAVLNTPPLGCNINVKVFEVPSTAEEKKIPFARVNHAKYMVTDRVVYLGTSNWSENYFSQTAGVGIVVNQTGSVVAQTQRTLQSQLQKVFQRDWTSTYARSLSNDDAEHCGRRH